MANLSQDDRDIISEHSLGKSLDLSRDLLRRLKPDSLSHDAIIHYPDRGLRIAILRLLYNLLSHKVAVLLDSKTGRGDGASKLSTLCERLLTIHFHWLSCPIMICSWLRPQFRHMECRLRAYQYTLPKDSSYKYSCIYQQHSYHDIIHLAAS